jgi:hypothetical protein
MEPQAEPAPAQVQAEAAVNDDVAAYQQMRAAGIDPFAGNTQGGGLVNPNERALSPEELATVQSMTTKTSVPDETDMATSEEGKAELMRQRFRKLKAQEAIDGGGGPFRRGE